MPFPWLITSECSTPNWLAAGPTSFCLRWVGEKMSRVFCRCHVLKIACSIIALISVLVIDMNAWPRWWEPNKCSRNKLVDAHIPILTMHGNARPTIPYPVQASNSNHPRSRGDATKWADLPSSNQSTWKRVHHWSPLFCWEILCIFKSEKITTSRCHLMASTRHSTRTDAEKMCCRSTRWASCPLCGPGLPEHHRFTAGRPTAFPRQTSEWILIVLTWRHILQVLQTVVPRITIQMMDLPCFSRFWRALKRDHNYTMNFPKLPQNPDVSISRCVQIAIAENAVQIAHPPQWTHSPSLGSAGSRKATKGCCKWDMQVYASDHRSCQTKQGWAYWILLNWKPKWHGKFQIGWAGSLVISSI